MSFAFYFTQLALKSHLTCIQVDLASIVSNCDSRDTPYLLVAWRTFVMRENFIIFSFQFTSPYAYNAYLRVLCLCHRHSIRAMVYLLSPWLAHWINLMWRPWIMNVMCIKVLWNLFQYPVELSLSMLTWRSSLTVLRREHLLCSVDRSVTIRVRALPSNFNSMHREPFTGVLGRCWEIIINSSRGE